MKASSLLAAASAFVTLSTTLEARAADDRIIDQRTMVGDAAIYFRGWTSKDATAAHRPEQLLFFSADARMLFPLVGKRLGPAVAIDLDLGVARPLASAYGFHVSPVGAGFALGHMGYVAAVAGVGFGGVTASQAFDLELPLSARLALDVSDRARIIVDARAMFTPDARDHNRASVGDETRVGLGVRVGKTWREYSNADAGGYFYRLERVERAGTTYFGLALGYELGGAF